MEKTISAFDARRQFGKLLQEVVVRGDKYVVERHGEAVAVVVPIEVYEQWKRERTAFFEGIREAQRQADLSPEEGAKLAEGAVRAIRTDDQS